MSRPATTKLKVNPMLGNLPVLQYCAPEQLLIDDSYQRSLEVDSSQALIRRIATYWDWGLCQPLFVARRSDGGLYVVDGQHRLAAALLRGDIHQLPCVVSHFDSAEQEAATFVALNQQRRPLQALDLFKAALAAGDFEACQVAMCVKDAGLRLASSTNLVASKAGGISNVGGLLRCYRVHGVQVLSTSLKVLAGAYPQQVLRYAGSIFPGVVAVVAAELHHRADLVDLADALAAHVGEMPQHYWYKRFAQAIAEDHMLRRSSAAEKVLRASWTLRKDGNSDCYAVAPIPVAAAESVLEEVVSAPGTSPAPSFLRPAEIAWCEQCYQRVSGAKAAKCASRFCKLKVRQAA